MAKRNRPATRQDVEEVVEAALGKLVLAAVVIFLAIWHPWFMWFVIIAGLLWTTIAIMRIARSEQRKNDQPVEPSEATVIAITAGVTYPQWFSPEWRQAAGVPEAPTRREMRAWATAWATAERERRSWRPWPVPKIFGG
jgi:hypothetical protein